MDPRELFTRVENSRAHFERFCAAIRLPRMRRVQQIFSRDEVADIPATVKAQLESSGIGARLKPGSRIAVCAGSRGVANIPLLVKATVDWIKGKGGIPFVMPAMGSHGGGTAEGQADMLRTLGITEQSVGAPVVSHMETDVVGHLPEYDLPVHVARDIMQADGCILVCRIKPHTSFRGTYESGLMKMLTIGAGKHNGALSAHSVGMEVFHNIIPLMGRQVIDKAPILGGVAAIENAFYKTAKVVALRADRFMDEEPALLRQAFAYMGRIYFDNLDVLMVDEIGKNFSGDGMDPNITGTFATPYAGKGLQAFSRIVFALSEETHGNASGLGMADFTTPKVCAAFDPVTTYTNALTAHITAASRLPLIVPDENLAVRLAIQNAIRKGAHQAPRIVHIDNTEQIEYITISEPLWEEAEQHQNVRFLSDPFTYTFTAQGEIIRHWK